MLKFILRRLISGAVLLLLISAIAFGLLYLGGGDIARRILGEAATAQTVIEKSHSLGLDRPLYVQYFEWLRNAFQGNLGESWFTGQPVAQAITTRIAVTLSLVIGTTILVTIISVTLGVWAAVRRGWVDRFVQFIAVFGHALPSFLIALGLVMVFALNLGWFKPTGYVNFTDSVSGWVATVTLPIVALTIGGVAGVALQVRGSVVDALRQDYVRTLRSRGLPQNRVIFKHVLRNAGGPALAVLSLHIVALLGGAVIVEQIFAIPGLGQVSVTATSQGDVPLVMGLVIITAIIVVIVNLIIDLLQGWLNPKVRLL